MLKNASITVKILILTSLLGVGIWLASDHYQTDSLRHIFHGKLAERFSREAQEHRTRFDNYVKVYAQAATLVASTKALHSHIHERLAIKRPGPDQIVRHEQSPPWMPGHAVMRKFVLPRYAQLLDAEGNTRELYYWNQQPPPPGFIDPSPLLIRLAYRQSYLTTLNNQPFLVTVEHIEDDSGKRLASVMLGTPLDSQFLRETQRLSSTHATVALLDEDQQTILVSSNPKLIPSGTRLAEVKNLYQTTGEGFFDYGSTDLVIKFASFIPLSEVRELTGEVLEQERTLRGFTTLAYTLAFLVVIFFFIRRLVKLTQRVLEFSSKMQIRQPRIASRDELQILEERFNTLAREIRYETEALEYQASHDPLTDLPNRKMLTERLQNELLHYGLTEQPLVLMISDLDHFKEINDTLGHHIGDIVLQQAAERLHNTVRRNDTVARLGGDEFSVLLPDTTLEQATEVAVQINEVFSSPFVAEGHNLNVGISIGIVESPQHGADVNILVQRADVAMYNAKRENTGYSVYDPKYDKHNISRLELMSELRDAIQNETLEVYYQCKVDLDSGGVIGAEALLRWPHPERGPIPPDDFIPLAEQTGLINPLTHWVLRQSLARCALWRREGYDLSVSINISVQCLYDNELPATLRRCLEEFGLPPHACTLEITESDIMTDPILAKSTLLELTSIGVNVSVDDFGTGYSSLAYLKQLPVSEIKIDRSFVMEMLEDENDLIIVRTIIDLAHNLDLKVVAEGVESGPALAMLKQMRCNSVQGFFISHPVPPEAFVDFLRAQHRQTNAGTAHRDGAPPLSHSTANEGR